jgi:recombination protein RecA
MASKLSAMFKKNFPDAMCADIISEIEYLDSGIPTLNYVMSGKPFTGGIPLNGKITVMYGTEGSGKTSYANQLIAQAQKRDFEVLYIDSETTVTQDRIEQFGIDKNKDGFIYVVPDNMEQVFEMIEDACKEKIKDQDNIPLLIVWDTIAATGTKDEIERTSYDKEIGSQSSVLTRNLRRIRPLLRKAGRVGCLFVNQARDNQEMYGDIFKMPGGRAIQHEGVIILRVNKIKPGETSQGVRISSTKNKIFNPYQSTTIQFDYARGFTKEYVISAYSEFLKDIGLIGQSGAWCFLTDEIKAVVKEKNINIDTESKFYLKDFTTKLLENEQFYKDILMLSEGYVAKNIAHVSSIFLDKDIDIEAEKKKNEELDKEMANSINEDDNRIKTSKTVIEPEDIIVSDDAPKKRGRK